MSWWRPFREPLSDDAIAERVAAMVAEGEIKAEMAPHIERALRDEAACKCVIMRNYAARAHTGLYSASSTASTG
jgi:hypothetical protein